MFKKTQLFRRDMISNGGGVRLYVKSTIPCELRPDLELEDVESIWLTNRNHF
jgi:hypothetical protein